MPARSTVSRIRFASSAVRASGFVQRTALPCFAQSSIASSCRSFGSPTITVSVSGCAIACSRSVDHSGTPSAPANARARSSERE